VHIAADLDIVQPAGNRSTAERYPPAENLLDRGRAVIGLGAEVAGDPNRAIVVRVLEALKRIALSEVGPHFTDALVRLLIVGEAALPNLRCVIDRGIGREFAQHLQTDLLR